MKPTAVAVIGLGLMGSRMAARLLGAGHRVRGYDPDPARMEEFRVAGGEEAGSPVEAVEGTWAALLSLPNSDVSRQVCLEDAGIAAAGRPLYVFDATTGRPSDAVEIGQSLGEVGIEYGDATVSGNAPVAAAGQLVVMFGGSTEAYEAGEPIFTAIGRSHHHVGPVGAGSRMKLIVNHVLAIHRLALAEGLVVAELASLDLGATLEVLKDSLAYSKAMDIWGERIIAGDHLPPSARLRQSHKDARLILEHGRQLGASLLLMEVVEAALEQGEQGGLADFDNSAVAEVVRRRAGIGRWPEEEG
ncbi:MAG TPA: NAD(P)-dependent oxidoreductase [Acidimicrobiia bacterium]|nr:NAD(P)-dependent oxidoreductase [Acidimicrobiia bacterium]